MIENHDLRVMKEESEKEQENEKKEQLKLIEPTKENLANYWNYLEYCNILRDKYYTCPFCGKLYKYISVVFNHLEKKHNYYGRGN